MGSPLPPDPYQALGVAKDATYAEIKTAHRKLALKSHPDKIGDPEAKAAASDLFHRIQTAYEILSDEDRRGRYDAQVRLAELRKEVMQRGGGGSARHPPTRSASDLFASSSPDSPLKQAYASATASPRYEERRPQYADSTDYFDAPPPPKSTPRREAAEFERTSRRYFSDTNKERSKPTASSRSAKENERASRKEKSKRTERDTKRDRDRKYNVYAEDEPSSDSDEYARRARRMREEDEQRRAREAYYEQIRRQRDEAEKGYYADDRARKMFSQGADATEYIKSRSRPPLDPEPYTSSPRPSSAKDKVESAKRSEVRPPAASRRSAARRSSMQDDEPPPTSRRGSTRDTETVEEPRERERDRDREREQRRPPPLGQAKSSPSDILLPPETRTAPPPPPPPQPENVRSSPDLDQAEMPRFRRAETMPLNTSIRTDNTAPAKSSNLRRTEFTDGLPTPGTTPEYPDPPARYQYGRSSYEDQDTSTPADNYRGSADSYRTEIREPRESRESRESTRNSRPSFTRRITRSPSPISEVREPRDRSSRPSASRFPPSSSKVPSISRTTSYVYTPGQGVETYDPVRHASSRTTTGSPRIGEQQPPTPSLFGEIRRSSPDTGARPSSKYNSSYPPPTSDNIRYQREFRPEDIKIASGRDYAYSSSRRPTAERTSSSRQGPIHVK